MLLSGKRGVVLSVTNDRSIGWAIAEEAHKHGAEIAVGAQNEKMMERIGPLLEPYDRMFPVELDFRDEEGIDRLVATLKNRWGTIDFFVHSAAFAPKEALMGRFLDTTREDYLTAVDVSAYSLIRMCRAFEPIFAEDASVITLSYLGATRASHNYKVMGVAKAALESAVRYLAVDLGDRGIRVNTLSPGPVNTVAARGVKNLIEMIDYVHEKAPLKRPYGAREVGHSAVYLLSDLSQGVTGQIIFIDSGYSIMGL